MNRPLEMLTIDNDIKYSESLCRDAQRSQILLKHRDKHEDAKLFLKSDEEKMLNACIQGSKEAWDAFVEKYTKLIYHAINKTLESYNAEHLYQDSSDIHNSVLLSLWNDDFRKLKQYKGKNGCTVSSWLMVVTTNFTLNYIKKQKKYKPIEDDTTDNVDVIERVSDPQQQPGEELLKKEFEEMRKKLVKVLVKDLNANDKLFLELSYERKLPPEEIAEILGVAVNNVYSKKNRIIEKLKKTAKKKNLLQDLLHLLHDN